MIRRALLAVVVLLAGVVTQAQAVTPLALWVDADGTSYLWNTTGDPLTFDGYQIESAAGKLDPVGWKSIADQVLTNTIGVIGGLGPGALSFGEAAPISESTLAEINMAQAGTLNAGAKFSIGKPFSTLPPSADALGGWQGPTGGSMDIVYAPEPAAWLLAGMAGFGCWVFRRRPRS